MADGIQNIRMDKRKLEQLINGTPADVDRAVRGAGQQVTNEIITSFNTGPAGRSYTRGSVTHVASSPGHPPNVDTGAYRASIRWESRGHATVRIMDGVDYGVHLEFGTEHVAARPLFTPVFMRWRTGEFERYLSQYGLLT